MPDKENNIFGDEEIALDYDILTDTIHHLSPQISAVFGIARIIEHAPEFLVRCGVIQTDSAHEFLECFRQVRSGSPGSECLIHARTATDQQLWVRMTLTTYFNENRMPIRAMGILQDVTSQYENYHKNSIQEEKKAVILKRSALLYYEVDLTECRVIFGLNDIKRALRKEASDDFYEIIQLIIQNAIFPDDRELLKAIIDPEKLIAEYQRGHAQRDIEYRRFLGNGTIGWVCSTFHMSENPNSGHILLRVYVIDINDQKMASQSLRERTELDSLTGIYNTVTFELRVREELEKHKSEPNGTGALFILNIDDFKAANQFYGRFIGDSILAEVGQNIRTTFTCNCIPGRIGGDEFGIYFKNLPSQDSVEQVAQSLYQSLHENQSTSVGNNGYTVTLGIAVCTDKNSSLEELIHHAKLALLEGKHQGKNRWIIYNSNLPIVKEGTSEDLMGKLFEGKTFAENLTEYIFRILYSSKDLGKAIIGVLELVSEHFNFNRGFLFETTSNGGAECTFEWVSEKAGGTPVQSKHLTPEEMEACRQLFGRDGLHIARRRDLDEEHLATLRFDKEYRLLCALTGSLGYHGFIGFDNDTDLEKDLKYEDLKLIQSIAQMLDVFWTDRNSDDDFWETKFLLQALADGLQSCTYIIDMETHVLRFSNENMLQVIPEACPGTLCYETIRGKSEPCDDCPFLHMVEENTVSYQTEMYLDKYQLWAKISSSLVTAPSGTIYGIFNGYDFSSSERGLNYQPEDVSAFTDDAFLYSALSRSMDDYIYMCDLHTNVFYFPQELVDEFELPGQIIKDAIPVWAERIHEEDRDSFLNNFNNMLGGRTDTLSQEYRILNKDNMWIWLSSRGHVERDSNGVPTMLAGVMTKLGQRSKIDSLTGLPNKYEFEQRTRAMLAGNTEKGVLLLLGLDNFKYINDIYGWDFGDSVIQESTQRLLDALPDKVQLYHLDGDKFGVFFPDTEQYQVEKYYEATTLSFRHHRQYGTHRYFCTVSGGCSVFDGEVPDFALLYKQATFALDFAKRRGKDRLAVYDEASMGNNERLLQIITELHRSVDSDFDGFAVYYQPQIRPKTFELTSAEALLRWTCPGLGMISPVEFIPLLEQSGLIHKVGRWVLEQADRVSMRWRAYVPDFTVSVNLSYIQLRDTTFFTYLAEQIKRGHIHPHHIHLEITESCISDGSKLLTEQFRTLRKMGFCIEMDDFGTGYSSLEILKNAPSDVVKIDRAFVRDLGRSKFDSTFIQFVTTLCHSVDILVCLEGVESWNEYNLVESMNLDLIQGFLFSHPLPEQEFEDKFVKVTPEEIRPLIEKDRGLFKVRLTEPGGEKNSSYGSQY